MKTRLVAVICVVFAIYFVGAVAYALSTPKSPTEQLLASFDFKREAARTPEAAAQSLYLGVSTASPRDFVKHLLLSVCSNEIDVLQDFAESLHSTRFSHDDETFTYYDLRDQRGETGKMRLINRGKPIRVIATASFDATDPQVKALEWEGLSTYQGKRCVCVDVAGVGYYDGLEYRTRIVVSQTGDGWYAIPRCRSSKKFYTIADAMSLEPADTQGAK